LPHNSNNRQAETAQFRGKAALRIVLNWTLRTERMIVFLPLMRTLSPGISSVAPEIIAAGCRVTTNRSSSGAKGGLQTGYMGERNCEKSTLRVATVCLPGRYEVCSTVGIGSPLRMDGNLP
jgi:hypothetical protein